MTTLPLVKHHGLGNDFLVAFDPPIADEGLAELARFVCDRRAGVGADGLLVGSDAPGHDGRMVLYNADGSWAEMSGNGVRCFAHALAMRDGGPIERTMSIVTDAGVRCVDLVSTNDPNTLSGSVDMGEVMALDAPPGWTALGVDPGRPVAHLSLGNPHSVVPVDDVSAVDLATLGAIVPDVNLEIIEPGPTASAITMRVHERGAGITLACGTGACAAAFAARRWGLATPDRGKLVVHMDGGHATVEFDPDRPERVTLTGPTTFVGTIEIPAPPR